MTPAGTSNELDVQNKLEENTHTHSILDGRVFDNIYHIMLGEVVVVITFQGVDTHYIFLQCHDILRDVIPLYLVFCRFPSSSGVILRSPCVYYPTC